MGKKEHRSPERAESVRLGILGFQRGTNSLTFTSSGGHTATVHTVDHRRRTDWYVDSVSVCAITLYTPHPREMPVLMPPHRAAHVRRGAAGARDAATRIGGCNPTRPWRLERRGNLAYSQ